MGTVSVPTPVLYPAFREILRFTRNPPEIRGRLSVDSGEKPAPKQPQIAVIITYGCYHSTSLHKSAHSGLQGQTRGVLDGGAITTLRPFCTVRKPCAAGCQNGKLCRFWVLVEGALEERREPAGQRCAYARRCPAGVAAPLGCVIPLLFPSPHRWVSRFWSAASLAHRKLSACSLVTAVRFWNRCSRRSMRETYPLEQRSGCRF